MNYIYDIYVNFNQTYYDVYEWMKKDKIINIKKMPIFKVNTYDLKTIIKNEIIVDSNILNSIKKQTEFFTRNQKSYFCAFTDSKSEIAVQINKNGKIIKKSSIHFTDNSNSFSTIKKMNIVDFKYSIIKRLPINFLSRCEVDKIKYLTKQIDKLDSIKLTYLYLECFNKKEEQQSFIISRLKKEIMDNNEYICNIIDNFFKLIYIT